MQLKQNICSSIKPAQLKHQTEHHSNKQMTLNISTATQHPLKIHVRIAKAWRALNRLKVIWKSALLEQINNRFFIRAVTESVLIYGSPAWTLSKKLVLNGTCTRMLRAVLNWKTHPTISCLCSQLPRISSLIRRKKHDMPDTVTEEKMRSSVMEYCGILNTKLLKQ